MNNLAQKQSNGTLRKSYAEQSKETQIHIERIRAMLLAETPEPQEA